MKQQRSGWQLALIGLRWFFSRSLAKSTRQRVTAKRIRGDLQGIPSGAVIK
jgi:hypothetical protein